MNSYAIDREAYQNTKDLRSTATSSMNTKTHYIVINQENVSMQIADV